MTTSEATKVRLWESQREYAICLAELGVRVSELCELFGGSDAAMRAALGGLKASTGFRDLTGGKQRIPAMSRQEYDAIVVLAERQLTEHPELRPHYDRLCKLLAATFEDHHVDVISEVYESGPAGALERIADAYVSLGEQLFKLVGQLRTENLEDAVIAVLDHKLDERVNKAIEAFFS